MVVLACLFTCPKCGKRAAKWYEPACPGCREKRGRR